MDKFSQLEGQVLTLLEASISDREQREAAKSLFRRMFRGWKENEFPLLDEQNCTHTAIHTGKTCAEYDSERFAVK